MGHGRARVIVRPERGRRAPVDPELFEACARGPESNGALRRWGGARATGQLRRAARGVSTFVAGRSTTICYVARPAGRQFCCGQRYLSFFEDQIDLFQRGFCTWGVAAEHSTVSLRALTKGRAGGLRRGFHSNFPSLHPQSSSVASRVSFTGPYADASRCPISRGQSRKPVY